MTWDKKDLFHHSFSLISHKCKTESRPGKWAESKDTTVCAYTHLFKTASFKLPVLQGGNLPVQCYLMLGCWCCQTNCCQAAGLLSRNVFVVILLPRRVIVVVLLWLSSLLPSKQTSKATEPNHAPVSKNYKCFHISAEVKQSLVLLPTCISVLYTTNTSISFFFFFLSLYIAKSCACRGPPWAPLVTFILHYS